MRENYYQNKGKYVIGIFLISAVLFIYVDKIEFVNFLEIFFFSMLAVVILDWFADLTSKQELFDKVFKYFNHHQENQDLGFEKVSLNAERIDYEHLISNSKEITVSQVTGGRWLSANQKYLIKHVKKENTKLTFILMGDDNLEKHSLSNLFYGGDTAKFISKIEQTKELCTEIKAQAHSSSSVNIVKIQNTPMFGAIYLFDNHAVQIPLTTNKSKFENFLSYQFSKSRSQNGESAYDILENQIIGLTEAG